MYSSLLKFTTLALAAINAVHAHTHFSEIYVDGNGYGKFTCIRRSTAERKADPVMDMTSSSMACNVGGEKGVARTCPVPDGAKLTLEYRIFPQLNNDTDRGIQTDHWGPCSVYMKKVDSAINDNGAGEGWFKIFHEDLDESTGRWCTEKLQDNNGFLTIDLPRGLQRGDYLIRPELLALHGFPQFYMGCAQIFLDSDGDLLPDDTVAIPGYIDESDPGVNYSEEKRDAGVEYIIPGPDVQQSFSSSGQAGPSEQTEGLRPEGCILDTGNACITEFSDYSTQDECRKVADQCRAEKDRCEEDLHPFDAANCKVLGDEKCKPIDESCNAENPSLPNAGVDITPVTRINLSSLASLPPGLVEPTSPLAGGESLKRRGAIDEIAVSEVKKRASMPYAPRRGLMAH